MNRRRLALKVAVVGIVAVAGLGVAATPALAMPAECGTFRYWNARAAWWLNQDGLTFAQWNAWYDLWLQTEDDLAANC